MTRWCAGLVAAGLLLVPAPAPSQTGGPFPYRNRQLPVDARVRDLLGRMTLEEKFWQLFMIPGDLDDPAHDYSHGIFGLQISTARAGAAGVRTARGPRRADQRHPALLRRADPARHSDHPVRGSRARPAARRRHDVSRRPSRWPRHGTRRSSAASRARSRAKPAAAASARCSRRSSTSRTTCGGAGWRRPTARIPCLSSMMGRAFIGAVRAGRHRHDAEAFRRQRRRRRARQLSDRHQRACARRAVLPAVRIARHAGGMPAR